MMKIERFFISQISNFSKALKIYDEINCNFHLCNFPCEIK